jgi:hypothetical protein
LSSGTAGATISTSAAITTNTRETISSLPASAAQTSIAAGGSYRIWEEITTGRMQLPKRNRSASSAISAATARTALTAKLAYSASSASTSIAAVPSVYGYGANCSIGGASGNRQHNLSARAALAAAVSKSTTASTGQVGAATSTAGTQCAARVASISIDASIYVYWTSCKRDITRISTSAIRGSHVTSGAAVG